LKYWQRENGLNFCFQGDASKRECYRYGRDFDFQLCKGD
jgi:hypothetical protein